MEWGGQGQLLQGGGQGGHNSMLTTQLDALQQQLLMRSVSAKVTR